MATTYGDAIAELFRAQPEAFVAERKRLSGELKTAGDKDGAQRLAKLARPSVSAWAVNQLYWRSRDEFEALLDTAKAVREGDLGAAAVYREMLGALRAVAGRMLSDAGHSANEATLRRMTATLSAVAAAGGFEPDPPGALSADRDPPGFEAAAVTGNAGAADKPQTSSSPSETELVDARARAEAAERQRVEQERARRRAERERLESAMVAAQREVDARTSSLERLRRDLADGEQQLVRAQVSLEEIRARLAALSDLE
jgi:hypothetical protein